MPLDDAVERSANGGPVTPGGDSGSVPRAVLARYRNYLLVTVAGACIFSWYFSTDFIGVHDAWAHIPAMKVCYDCARAGTLPIWSVKATSSGNYLLTEPAFPTLSPTFLLASFLPFVAWFKLHVFVYLLLGALGIVAYLESKGVMHAMPAVAGIVVFFSGCMQAHAVFYANTWLANMAFLPWLMVCADKRKWIGVTVAIALLAYNGPLHCIIFVLCGSFIYVAGMCGIRGWRTVVRYSGAMGLGLLLGAFVVIPVLANNFTGTVGRESPLILMGYQDVFHCLSSYINRWDHAPYWVRPADESPLIVMWPFYYAYLGIIPFVLVVVGTLAALCMWKTNRAAFVCACICLVVFVCCCGVVWRWFGHVPLLGKLPKINIVPTRMTPLILVFGACAASMSLSRLLGSLRKQLLVFWLVAGMLAWATADYTLLFWQMKAMQPVQDAKPLMAMDVVSNEVFTQKLGFNVEPAYHVRFGEPHGWVPGNGMYFVMISTGAMQLSICDMDTNFIARRLHIKSLETGKDIKKNGALFSIPVAADIYRIYLHDGAITLGIVVSLGTLIACGVRRYGQHVPGIVTVLMNLQRKKKSR